MWHTSSSTSGTWSGFMDVTSGGYCPHCGYSLGNDACSIVVTVSRPNYFVEEGEDPLNGDNWRPVVDAPRRTPSPKWCRLRPEVRAPPGNLLAVIAART